MKNALAAAVLSLSAVGCALSCTEIGCLGGMTFAMDIASDGAWALQVDDDEVIIDCEFELPADVGEVDCVGVDGWAALEISEADVGYVATLSLYNHAPESVWFGAWRDGESVADITETPEYSEWYPNGEQCDRDNPCRSAVVDVSLE